MQYIILYTKLKKANRIIFYKKQNKYFSVKILNENHLEFILNYTENKKHVNKKDLYYKYQMKLKTL